MGPPSKKRECGRVTGYHYRFEAAGRQWLIVRVHHFTCGLRESFALDDRARDRVLAVLHLEVLFAGRQRPLHLLAGRAIF